jgi:hypothetical protein
MMADGASFTVTSISIWNFFYSLVKPALLPPFKQPYVFAGFCFVLFSLQTISPNSSKVWRIFPLIFFFIWFHLSVKNSLARNCFSLAHKGTEKKWGLGARLSWVLISALFSAM